MKIRIALFFSFLLLSACQDQQGEVNFEEGARQIGKVLDSATEGLREITPSRDKVETVAKDEVDKLTRVDYKVVRLDAETPPDEIQGVLELLGKDGWDCFHIWHHQEKLTFFCKKRPFSYLKYLPRPF